MSDELQTRKVIYEAQRQSRGGDRPRPKSAWKRNLIIVGVVLFALAGLGATYFIWHSLTFVSTTRAQVCAAVLTLSPEVDARVQRVEFVPGQHVAKDQVIIRLDDSELRAALVSAQAGEALAETRLISATRALELRKSRLPEEIRRAQAQRDAAAARFERLKKGARSEDIEAAKVRLATTRTNAELMAKEVEFSAQLVKAGYESPHSLTINKTKLVAQENLVREAELALEKMQAGSTAEEMLIEQQNLESLEATLSLSKMGESEIESLSAEKAGRQAELDQARSDVIRCKAALEKAVVVSPVDGTLIRTFAREGEICRRTTPVALVANDAEGRWVEGYIVERDATRLKIGQTADIELIVGSGRYARATVEAVALATSSLGSAVTAPGAPASAVGELVWVKLHLARERKDLLPGMSAWASIRVR